MTDHPRSHHRAFVRENWYRDVWLLLITVVVGLTAWSASIQADRARSLARTTHTLAQAIQQQRADAIQAECAAQNHRNRATVRTLDQVLRREGRHARPFRARQLRSRQRVTVLLINALAPVQNCRRTVAGATRLPHKP